MRNPNLINNRLRRVTFRFLFVILIFGCDDGTGPPLSSLSLLSTSVVFSSLGETFQLKLSARTLEGDDFKNPKVTWVSGNPEVATISKTGLITSVANGATEIIATVGSLTTESSVVVAQVAATVDLSVKNIRFENIGDTAQIFSSVQDALGNSLSNPLLSWNSSSPSVVTTTESGKITAIGLGESLLTVQTGTASSTARISVSHWQTISAGHEMTCGLRTSAEVYCWGNNDYGQIGDGTSERGDAPTLVDEGLESIYLISMINHNCGILSDKLGVCWGNNDHGQIGDGTSEQRGTPTPISGAILIEKLAGGFQHTCANTISGDIKCWGRSNFGQLGTGNSSSQAFPSDISLQVNWDDLAAGSYHTCATTTSNQAYCWGLNQFGQLGNGTTSNKNTPEPVFEGNLWLAISAGLYHTCGINQSGEAYCWGLNDNKQLGSDRNQNQWPYPDKVNTTNIWTSLSAGRSHTCGINHLGKAFCWGSNEYGQLGDATQIDRSQPTPVSGDFDWTHIKAGVYHTCGVTAYGSGYCWGTNEYNQVGPQASQVQLIPTKIGIAKY